jgi:hypothetical protein
LAEFLDIETTAFVLWLAGIFIFLPIWLAAYKITGKNDGR